MMKKNLPVLRQSLDFCFLRKERIEKQKVMSLEVLLIIKGDICICLRAETETVSQDVPKLSVQTWRIFKLECLSDKTPPRSRPGSLQTGIPIIPPI